MLLHSYFASKQNNIYHQYIRQCRKVWSWWFCPWEWRSYY